MNIMELNVAMMRNNANAEDMSKAIKKSRVSFNKKRFGEIAFSVDEALAIAEHLSLNIEQVNCIFFDGKLQ